MTSIREARAALTEANRALETIAAKRRELQERLDADQDELDGADETVRAKAGAVALGEAPAAELTSARKRKEDLTVSVDGLETAIAELERRERVLEKQIEHLERSVLAAASAAAHGPAERELEKIRALAEELGASLQKWMRLNAIATHGGWLTGDRQVEKTRVTEILRGHGVGGGVVIVERYPARVIDLPEIDELAAAEDAAKELSH